MSAERKFTPVSEVESDLVTLQLNLPAYINPDLIGLNLGKTEKLMRLSGLTDLSVTGVGGQETSSEYPTVVGFDKGGGAYAGSIGVKVNVSEHKSSPSSYLQKVDSSTKDVSITLNLDEINEQIAKEKWNGGIRSIEAWSKHLDSAIKTGIKSEGTKNLLLLDDPLGLTIDGMTTVMLAQSFAFAYRAGPLWVDSVISMALFLKTTRYLFSDQKNYRLSPFFGTHFERAAALNVMVRKGKLVKELPKAE